MKMRIPLGLNGKPSTGVGVEGKFYTPVQGVVELPDRTPADTFCHLLTLGWKLEDNKARQIAEEIGIKIGTDGQPIFDETSRKAFAGKR